MNLTKNIFKTALAEKRRQPGAFPALADAHSAQLLTGAGFDRLRYPHDHVLDDMLRGLGLEVGLAKLPFEPEAGAYGPADRHAHEHESGHDHA